jgi:carbonic anhydrase
VDKVQAATQSTPTSQDADFVHATIRENVRLTMGRILEKSIILNDLHMAGTIDVVGGVYQLDSGEVTWLD